MYLPPGAVNEQARTYTLNVRLGKHVRALRYTERDGILSVESNAKLGVRELTEARALTSRVFRLHDDLSPFYAMIVQDAQLSWAIGAGRLPASPTVFEDVVKTIATTNCSWAATTRMVSAMVELGGGAFPDPQSLATTPDRWFKDIARMGYRGPYVKEIARDVARGTLDLEGLLPLERRDPELVENRLLELPGVGPYAAAHIMQLLGYHHRLVLDSWTRPRFLKIFQKRRASDGTITKAFKRYGKYAGLAFWLTLTKEWSEG